MKITYLNTGGSVGNQTEWSSPVVIPIGKGLKQELLFEEMGNVTSMTISVYRAGSLMYQQTPVPSATMRIDLSVFSQVLPSLLETYKYSGENPASGIQEYIRFTIQDGATQRIYAVYVCSVPSPNLISYGFSNSMGANLCSPTASVCRQNNVTVVAPVTKYGFRSWVFGEGTKVNATASLPNTYVATLSSGLELVKASNIVSYSVYMENTGVPVSVVFRQMVDGGAVTEALKILPKGFKGVVSHTFTNGVEARYDIEVYTRSESGACVFSFHAQMLNYGGVAPWLRAGASLNSPCVGAMTDYRNGKCNALTTSNTEAVRDTHLAGFRRYPKLYFAVGAQNTPKTVLVNGVNAGTRWSGYIEGDTGILTIRLDNADGSVYGWLQFEQKNPNPPLPTCSVLARWLNTKGWYDTMLFEKYTIKPIIDNLQNNEYEVTVQAEANWDNEPCLEWLQRSPDIVMRLPNDITQMGLATLTSTNVFTNVGGEKKKVFQYKFNVKLQKA